MWYKRSKCLVNGTRTYLSLLVPKKSVQEIKAFVVRLTLPLIAQVQEAHFLANRLQKQLRQ